MLRSTAGGGVSSLRIPSKPACNKTAIVKYGFAEGSTERNSKRVDKPRDSGTRMSGERFLPLQAT